MAPRQVQRVNLESKPLEPPQPIKESIQANLPPKQVTLCLI